MSAAIGRTRFNGVKYNTVARNITGLLAPGAAGVNHGEFDRPSRYSSDIIVKGIALDGIVTLLTVTID